MWGEAGKAIGEALKVNNALTELDLYYSLLCADGGKAIGEETLTQLGLGNNELDAGGALLTTMISSRSHY